MFDMVGTAPESKEMEISISKTQQQKQGLLKTNQAIDTFEIDTSSDIALPHLVQRLAFNALILLNNFNA